MTNYTTNIKEIGDALGSINVAVDGEEMVLICLGGLAQRYGSIRTTICRREKPSTFFDLQPMVMVEENHNDSQMLYTEADRPRGCGEHDGSARNSGGRQEQNQRHRASAESSGPSTSRGCQGGAGG